MAIGGIAILECFMAARFHPFAVDKILEDLGNDCRGHAALQVRFGTRGMTARSAAFEVIF